MKKITTREKAFVYQNLSLIDSKYRKFCLEHEENLFQYNVSLCLVKKGEGISNPYEEFSCARDIALKNYKPPNVKFREQIEFAFYSTDEKLRYLAAEFAFWHYYKKKGLVAYLLLRDKYICEKLYFHRFTDTAYEIRTVAYDLSKYYKEIASSKGGSLFQNNLTPTENREIWRKQQNESLRKKLAIRDKMCAAYHNELVDFEYNYEGFENIHDKLYRVYKELFNNYARLIEVSCEDFKLRPAYYEKQVNFWQTVVISFEKEADFLEKQIVLYEKEADLNKKYVSFRDKEADVTEKQIDEIQKVCSEQTQKVEKASLEFEKARKAIDEAQEELDYA